MENTGKARKPAMQFFRVMANICAIVDTKINRSCCLYKHDILIMREDGILVNKNMKSYHLILSKCELKCNLNLTF